MTVPHHLDAAVDKLKEASLRIAAVREGPATGENQKV